VKPHKFFQREGIHILCEVPITFSDAALGVQVEVPALNGKTTVKIPAGTQSGEVIELKRKGLPSLDGYGRGSQLVRIVCETPRRLSPEARELYERLREIEGKQKNSHPEKTGFLERLCDYFKGKGEHA
jgi:molecular chaperone DnaJ